MRRLPLLVLAVSLALMVSIAAEAPAAGPGGWDHLADGGTPGTPSLNGTVAAFNTDSPGVLLVGGTFTSAGGVQGTEHIASWNGTAWSGFGAVPLNGDVRAIAYKDGRVFAGGIFTNAGGDPNADNLAVWNGTTWASPCNTTGPAISGGVTSLQIIGPTLYIGGTYQNGAGIASADYLLACDLATGAARSPFSADGNSGPVYALAADSNGILYAGGPFINMDLVPAADHVASYDGTSWHALGSGAGQGGSAVTGIVRGLAANGTDIYVGTDAADVAQIPLADYVAKWNGSAWSAMGSNTAGSDGYFPTPAIYGFAFSGSRVFAGGQFQNANGDPLADNMVEFDGTAWKPVGSDGAGNGPLNPTVLAVAIFGQQLIAGGSFTSAGGDPNAHGAASYPLTAPLPPPVRGESVNAVPDKGTVLVKLPRGAAAGAKDAWTRAAAAGFVPLETLGRQLPVGSTLDTTKGTVLLSAARNAAGATQDGHFSQGLFTVLQSRKNPLTTLSMTGASLNGCSKLPRGGAPKASAARKRSRSLFSNVKGRFRTRGRNSTATVRGTRYFVKDTCKGTLTKVRAGTVTVRDLRLRKTKTLKAGQSYLALARR